VDEEGRDPRVVEAQSSVRWLKKKEKRPAERLSSVSGDDDDDSVGIELSHGGGLGRPYVRRKEGEGEGSAGIRVVGGLGVALVVDGIRWIVDTAANGGVSARGRDSGARRKTPVVGWRCWAGPHPVAEGLNAQ
jgi:hypothetical protein